MGRYFTVEEVTNTWVDHPLLHQLDLSRFDKLLPGEHGRIVVTDKPTMAMNTGVGVYLHYEFRCNIFYCMLLFDSAAFVLRVAVRSNHSFASAKFDYLRNEFGCGYEYLNASLEYLGVPVPHQWHIYDVGAYSF